MFKDVQASRFHNNTGFCTYIFVVFMNNKALSSETWLAEYRLLRHLSYARTARDFEARGLDGARDACRLLRHLSYARTTRDFEARGLDGARRDLDEYRRASARTFRHILMNCSLLLSLTGIRQRLPNPLPDPGLWL